MNELIIFGAKFLYLFIVILALVFVFHHEKERRLKVLYLALLALPLTYVIAKISSFLYYDPRPFVSDNFTPLLSHAPDNGFPSDHTLLSAAVAAVIYTFDRRWGFFLFFVAFFVGLARVLAGIHHISDIIGSIVIAIVTTYAVSKFIFPWFQKKFLLKNKLPE